MKSENTPSNTVGNLGPELSPAPKKKFQMPHIYVILVAFILVTAAATYLVPAGVFDRIDGPIEGRQVVDPDSFRYIESSPVGFLDLMKAIPTGLVRAADIIFFTFVVGGTFFIFQRTGLIEIGVGKLTKRFANNSIMVIPILMIAFGGLSGFIGVPELSLVYVPIILPLLLALGYDSVTAVAVALIATAAGFTGAITNPLVGISQSVAGLPLFSGVGFRTIVLLAILSAGIIYVMRYANKVKKNPELSLVYEEDLQKRKELEKDGKEEYRASARQIAASLTALAFFALLLYGIFKLNWFMIELAGLFLAMGIAVGLISGLKLSVICESFNEGCKSVFLGAFIIGVARAISVVLEQGMILDTIVYGLAAAVGSLPGAVTAVGMFAVQGAFNFLVPSGSGQALITMPIMGPLSDLVGVTRQTAVVAFHLGDGLSNIFFPTSGYFMATLALAGVAWTKWVKFIFPLMIIWTVMACILLVIAQAVQLGPF